MLYSNGQFVMAKPFYKAPKSASDFGVAELPTSVYDIFQLQYAELGKIDSIPASINVGSVGINCLIGSTIEFEA